MMLLGLDLDTAVSRLSGAPYQVRRLDNYWSDEGDWRVIKQQEADGVTVLTVALFRRVCVPADAEAENG